MNEKYFEGIRSGFGSDCNRVSYYGKALRGPSIGKVSAFPPSIYGEGKFLFGNIASIQNDKDGKPAWLLSGHWKSNLINMSENDKSKSSAFSTSFEMVMLDGKNAHTHAITNFILKGKSTEGNSTLVFDGTSSASLRNGLIPRKTNQQRSNSWAIK